VVLAGLSFGFDEQKIITSTHYFPSIKRILGAMRRFWSLVFLLGLLVTACVPQTDSGPSVAVVGAPAEFRVEGLADRFQTQLERSSPANIYNFVSRNRTSFQETHRDMAGSRAALQAAFTARAFGAEYAVMIAAPIFERELEEFTSFGTRKREIATRVQLEVVIIDPVTSEPLSTYTSGVYQGYRVETIPEDEELVEESEDPDLQAEIGRALNEIVPGVATDLELLVSRTEN
jgi:hypothetical protein